MLRFHLYLLLSLLMAAANAHAQRIETWQSPAMKYDKDDNPLHNYVLSDATGHYTRQYILTEKTHWTLRFNHFSTDFKLLTSKEVRVPYVDDMYNLNTFIIGRKFVQLMEDGDHSDGLLSYMALAYDLDGKVGKPVKLMDAPRKRQLEVAPVSKWAISPDSTKLLLAVQRRNSRYAVPSDEPQELYLAVLDSDAKLLWKKDLRLDLTEAEINITDWAVTDGGDVLVLAEVYDKAEVSKKQGAYERESLPSKIRLYRIGSADKSLTELPLFTGSGHASGCTINLQKANKLDCACFYSDQPKGNFIGLLRTQLEMPSGKALGQQKLAFDNELYGFFGEYNKEKGKAGIKSTFRFNRLLPRPDGGVLLLAGNDFDLNFDRFEEKSQSGPSRQTISTRHVRDDIAIFDLDANGKLLRKALFPRHVVFSYDNNSNVRFGDKYQNVDMYIQPMDKYFNDARFFLNDGTASILYYAGPNDLKPSAKRTEAPKIGGDILALGTLGSNGKTTITEVAEPKKKAAAQSNATALKLTPGNPLAYKVSCKDLGGKQWCFEVQYLAEGLR